MQLGNEVDRRVIGSIGSIILITFVLVVLAIVFELQKKIALLIWPPLNNTLPISVGYYILSFALIIAASFIIALFCVCCYLGITGRKYQERQKTEAEIKSKILRTWLFAMAVIFAAFIFVMGYPSKVGTWLWPSLHKSLFSAIPFYLCAGVVSFAI